MNRDRIGRLVAAASVLAVVIGLLPAGVSAGSPTSVETEPVIDFSTGDPATDPGTEGIEVARDGTLYVSAMTGGGGQVWRIAPGATEPEVLATLIAPTGGAGFGVLGLHLDRSGRTLLAAVHTLAEPERNGVWRIDTRTGAAEHLAGTEAIALPNDLTTRAGSIYVTDAAGGAIWRIHRGDVERWLADDLLAGTGDLVPGVPLGANGIDVHGRTLYVANTEKGTVVEVPIVGRRPGTPTVWAELGGNPDGLAVDRSGVPHVVLIPTNTLLRVERGNPIELVDDAEVFDAPSSLAFAPTSRGGASVAYVVNYSIGEGFPDLFEPSDVGPSVVEVRIVRGRHR